MLQVSTAVQHALVVCLQSDDVVLLLLVKVCNTLDGEVVGFCCSRGENDFFWICPNKGGNLQPNSSCFNHDTPCDGLCDNLVHTTHDTPCDGLCDNLMHTTHNTVELQADWALTCSK